MYNLSPTLKHTRRFYIWHTLTVCTFGYLFAEYFVDKSYLSNEWYTRPDMRPVAAMVEPTHEEAMLRKQLAAETTYEGRNALSKENIRRSAFYRLFFPYSADYTLKYDPISDNPTVYNAGRYEIGNNFRDHHHDM